MLTDDVELDRVPGLSTRAKGCLRNFGIKTVGDVRRTPDKELLKFAGFGMVSLRETRELLASDVEAMPKVGVPEYPDYRGDFQEAELNIVNRNKQVWCGIFNTGDALPMIYLTPSQARALASALKLAAKEVDADSGDETFILTLSGVHVALD